VPEQQLQQTEGWALSWAALQEAVRRQGPFDGVLGFSQVSARGARAWRLPWRLPGELGACGSAAACAGVSGAAGR
jgi:hypothetical protein